MAAIRQSTLNAINRHAQKVGAQAERGLSKATERLHGDVQRRARETPGWDALADYIEVWDQDGKLIIGVRENDLVSEAMGVEYGDADRPPSPLLRTLSAEMGEAGQVLADHFIQGGVAKPWQPPS